MSGLGEIVHLQSFAIGARTVECYGIRYSDTPVGEFDFYELYEDGACLNEGAPLFARPNLAEIERYLSGGEQERR